MTPYLLLAWSVAGLLAGALVVALVARWLGRQTEREERLRLQRWLAIFELDSDLLFETDNDSRLRMHAKVDRPLQNLSNLRRQRRAGTPPRPANHNLACLDHAALHAELDNLFEA